VNFGADEDAMYMYEDHEGACGEGEDALQGERDTITNATANGMANKQGQSRSASGNPPARKANGRTGKGAAKVVEDKDMDAAGADESVVFGGGGSSKIKAGHGAKADRGRKGLEVEEEESMVFGESSSSSSVAPRATAGVFSLCVSCVYHVYV
jgi:hypothetical protein